MNILNISSSHPFKAAGIVAYDVHTALKNNDFVSKLLVLPYDRYDDKDIISFRTHKYERKFERIFEKIKEKKSRPYDENYYFNGQDLTISKFSSTRVIKRIADFVPDAIIITFNKNFLSPKNIRDLYEYYNVPIYWYLMDPTPMTGGCAYTWDCEGFFNNCGNCPSIFSDNSKDISFINLQNKKKHFANVDLRFLVGSEGLLKQAKKSIIFKNRIYHKVLLPIDENKFSPIEGNKKLKILKQFSIPKNKRLLFFGAAKIKQKRKGIHLLISALEQIVANNKKNLDNCHFIVAGDTIEEINVFFNKNDIKYSYLGFLNHNSLAKIFGVTDCFICPSIQDAGPMMVNQSILSGCLVVGFPIGVCLDLVIDGITGFITEKIEAKELGNCLTKVINLDKNKLNKMKIESRKLGLSTTSFRYFDLSFLKEKR